MYYGFHKKIARVGDTSSTSLCKEDSERTRRLVGRHPKGRLGKMLKRQEQNACTMGGEKCINRDILSPLFMSQQQMSPLFCHRFVALCCQQCPAHAKGKPALCPSVLPLKAWLYSARIWQSRSFFDASRPQLLGWQRQYSEDRTAKHVCSENVSGHTWSLSYLQTWAVSICDHQVDSLAVHKSFQAS